MHTTRKIKDEAIEGRSKVHLVIDMVHGLVHWPTAFPGPHFTRLTTFCPYHVNACGYPESSIWPSFWNTNQLLACSLAFVNKE